MRFFRLQHVASTSIHWKFKVVYPVLGIIHFQQAGSYFAHYFIVEVRRSLLSIDQITLRSTGRNNILIAEALPTDHVAKKTRNSKK